MTITRTFLAFMSTLLLLGCGTSPKTHYYTLNTPPIPDTRSAAMGPIILIGPVTLPDLVDRPQLVLRSGENQVEISDTHRWAQSLKSEVARALAANLALEADAPRVYLLGQTLSEEADIRIALDILRFESAPASHATIEAQWSVRRKGTSKPITARFVVREGVEGNTHADLVAAHSRAIAKFSREIAATLRTQN
ncbi:MAG: PqiC family protein [Burkholderiales bacterium]|nr:PqiC family protein [Burkholderiales bacterium]